MACSLSLARPLPASLAGRAGTRPDHPISGPCSRLLHSDVSLALGFRSQEAVAAYDARDLLLGAINDNAEITKRLGIGLAHKAPELGVVSRLLSLHGKVYDFEARGDCLAAYRG